MVVRHWPLLEKEIDSVDYSKKVLESGVEEMKKRIIVVGLLCLAMLISLAGCGKEEKKTEA